jgi:hypothetical protein
MNKKPTVKVMFNQWGNYVCFVGTSRVLDTAEQWRAQDWLDEQVAKDKIAQQYGFATEADWSAYLHHTAHVVGCGGQDKSMLIVVAK